MKDSSHFRRSAGTTMMMLSGFGLLCPGSLLLAALGIEKLGPVTLTRGSSTAHVSGSLHGDLPSPWLVGAYLLFLTTLFAVGFALSHRNQP